MNINEAIGHGNLSNLQIRHIAALFEYQFPPVEIKKTESIPSNLSGIDEIKYLPSELFCPTKFTLDWESLFWMNRAQRLHLPHSSSKSTVAMFVSPTERQFLVPEGMKS